MRHQVGGDEDGIEVGGVREELPHRHAAGLTGEVPDRHDRPAVRVLYLGPVSSQPIDPANHVLRAGDGGDPPPARVDQPAYGEPGAIDVRDVDIGYG
jgi:hypothetical protein